MLRGCVTSQGVRVSTKDALAHAWATGNFEGYDAITLEAMLTRQDRDYLGISTIFGGTIRQAVLEYLHDYYLDLAQAWKTLRGTWLHKGFESVPAPYTNVLREKSLISNVGEYEVEGTMDLYVPYLQTVYDVKSIGKIYQDLPYSTHIGQLSGYRWLLQQNGYKVNQGRLIYLTFSEYVMLPVTFWPEPFVVQTIEETTPVFFAGIRDGVVPPKKWCNTRLCNVCPVREICEREADNEKPLLEAGLSKG